MMKAKRKKKSNIGFILIFVLGFLILMYPQISRFYYRMDAKDSVQLFDEASSKLGDEEIARRMELARAYNSSLKGANLHDPYSEEKQAEGRAEYARMLEVHEQIGHIKIPRINVNIPTYAGTSEEVLQKGAGHLEGTSLPIGGNYTHSVITAHSGLPKAKLFTDLEDLRIGDKFYFYNIEGVLAYQVDQIKVVEPADFSDLLIEPGHDYMTLLTCTPIMINSHRLLVRGHRVDYDPLEEQHLDDLSAKALYIKYAFYIIIILLIVLIGLNIYFIKSKRKFDRMCLEKLKSQQMRFPKDRD